MNSSMDNEPDPSKSSFLNLLPSLFISSVSKAAQFMGSEASLPMFNCLFYLNLKHERFPTSSHFHFYPLSVYLITSDLLFNNLFDFLIKDFRIDICGNSESSGKKNNDIKYTSCYNHNIFKLEPAPSQKSTFDEVMVPGKSQ